MACFLVSQEYHIYTYLYFLKRITGTRRIIEQDRANYMHRLETSTYQLMMIQRRLGEKATKTEKSRAFSSGK